jgi:tetratricopeptide (TPR) repeat protein
MMPHGLASRPPRPLRQATWCAAALALLLGAGCANTPPKPAVTPITTGSSSDASANLNQSNDASKAVTATVNKASSTPDNAATPTASKKRTYKSPMLAKSFEEAVERGDAAWSAGEVDMAIYQYVQALSFRPRDVTTLSKLGVIEQRQGNLQLATRALELAANASPSDARISARLGLIYLALGQDDNARIWLTRSADTASPDWRVYDGLGVVDEHRGDNAGALLYLQKALTLAPDVPTALLHRGQAMFNSGDYAGAEAAVRAALGHGDLAGGWELLGQIQAKRRAYPDSLDSLLRVLDAPAAYNAVAKSALDNGDNALALSYFQKASELSPVYFPEAERQASIARRRLEAASH